MFFYLHYIQFQLFHQKVDLRQLKISLKVFKALIELGVFPAT